MKNVFRKILKKKSDFFENTKILLFENFDFAKILEKYLMFFVFFQNHSKNISIEKNEKFMMFLFVFFNHLGCFGFFF